jgi:hypothetical protein
MNCQRFENVLSEVARGQMMEAAQRAEALTHSDACEDCAARLRDEEMLTRGLRSLAREMEPLEAPSAIETKLLAEFRSRPVTASPKRVNSRYWLSAVAAILLIAIAIVAMRSSSVKDDNPKQAQVEPPRVQEAPREIISDKPVGENNLAVNNEESPREVVPAQPKRRPNRVNRPAPTVAANHVTNEIATDFMPLGYMNAASLQDGGQIIRVELRRSALTNFGIPVNMDRYNEKVKADVVIGVDGLARAIRFVQ